VSPAWLPACHTQVNEYPGQRTFKAIGTGDQAFVVAMTACVEEVVGTVHEECISSRLSTKGNYISVTGEGGALSVARAHVWHSAHSTACPARIPAVLSGHVGGMSAACCVGRKGAWAGRQAGSFARRAWPRPLLGSCPRPLPCPACPAVGPVWVETPDQMLQIYEKMRADGRLRFFF
jgi:putative lipoic acid-binding regulatory protein